MPISDKRKIIFIHIPKNAGTAFMDSLGIEKTGHRLAQYYTKFPKKWKNYQKIAIIRNPWDRVVSNYNYARLEKSYWHSVNGKSIYGKHKDYDLLQNLSFKSAVKLLVKYPQQFKHQGWKGQFPYVCNKKGQIIVDNLIRYENLAEEFANMFPNDELLVKNSSRKNRDYIDYYDEETKQLVANFYAKDIKLFNYEFEG
jgi:hypothetical protein